MTDMDLLKEIGRLKQENAVLRSDVERLYNAANMAAIEVDAAAEELDDAIRHVEHKFRLVEVNPDGPGDVVPFPGGKP